VVHHAPLVVVQAQPAAISGLGKVALVPGLPWGPRLGATKVALEVALDTDPRKSFALMEPRDGSPECPMGEDCFTPVPLIDTASRMSPARGEFLDGTSTSLRFVGQLPKVPQSTWLNSGARILSRSLAGTDLGRMKVYLRWYANVIAPGHENDPFEWDYALDMTERLQFYRCTRDLGTGLCRTDRVQ
jgi:hypothetical protein